MHRLTLIFAFIFSLFVMNDLAFSQAMTVTSEGNVGIGITEPGHKLVVDGGNLRVTTGNRLMLGGPFSAEYLYNPDGTTLRIHVGEDDRIAIANNGNVGIGTIDPRHKLEVDGGNLRITTGNRLMLGGPFSAEYIYNPDGTTMRIHVGNDDRITIANNGNVGIGTTSPTEKLNVEGNILASGTITPGSSRTLKENIADLTLQEALDAVEALNPVKFNYIAEVEKDLHLGFIAEDVPEIVSIPSRMGVDPMDILAALTKVVQQQQREIEELKARLDRLQ